MHKLTVFLAAAGLTALATGALAQTEATPAAAPATPPVTRIAFKPSRYSRPSTVIVAGS